MKQMTRVSYGHQSVGDEGVASYPLLNVGGQHRKYLPTFSFQKKIAGI